jgi:molybdopterin synthase sulfur carrier subunit
MDVSNPQASSGSAPGVEVHLAYALRDLAGKQATVLASGLTVRDAIDALERDYPGMRFHLCYETGELRPYVNIFLNRENIRYLQGLDTPLPQNATLHILPSVAGGDHSFL